MAATRRGPHARSVQMRMKGASCTAIGGLSTALRKQGRRLECKGRRRSPASPQLHPSAARPAPRIVLRNSAMAAMLRRGGIEPGGRRARWSDRRSSRSNNRRAGKRPHTRGAYLLQRPLRQLRGLRHDACYLVAEERARERSSAGERCAQSAGARKTTELHGRALAACPHGPKRARTSSGPQAPASVCVRACVRAARERLGKGKRFRASSPSKSLFTLRSQRKAAESTE